MKKVGIAFLVLFVVGSIREGVTLGQSNETSTTYQTSEERAESYRELKKKLRKREQDQRTLEAAAEIGQQLQRMKDDGLF